jgi:hypothetical protein
MKKFLSALLAIGILVSSGLEPTAYAQKSSKPSSSGSSSSSKPSGSSSSKPSGGSSYSGSSGKGYSSGSKPSGGSSYSSSGGKSYSSGSSSTPPSSSKPPVSGSGGKSYSSGSSTPSTPKVSPPSKNPSVPVAPKPVAGSNGKSYTSGNKMYTPVSSNPSGSTKPKGGAFDGNAAEAKKREESKASYIKGAESRSSYTTPAGKETKIDSSSKSVTSIRSMSHTTYVTRETRIYSTYSPYYSRPVVIYNDPFPSLFWWWLLDRSLEERAMWAYHHQNQMDAARYRELCAKDAQLEARVRQLELQNKGVRDESYAPKGIDPDLQYSDDYVDAEYNPHTEHDIHKDSGGSSGMGNFCFYFFMTLLALTVIGLIVYFVFIYGRD